ncbi:MAG TPA: hypothetical protein VLB32_02950 [Candidatus Acidoferrales bacterium]|nr:hypothetical protein [Candidatus Acidoferrales bacterium]
MSTALLGGAVLWLAIAALAQSQQPPAQPQAPQAPKPRRVVVTFDGQLEDVPEVKPEDFQIEIGKQKTPPSRILKTDELPTLLAIVLQDNQPPDFGVQLPALRDFITSQPPNTYVGVFYLNGQTIDFVMPPPHFFSDLPKVAAALRAPNGNPAAAPPSPYDKVAQIVAYMDSLPEARKEILLFSEGSDSIAAQSAATPQQNKMLVQAVKRSVQAGIPVWVVYALAFAPETRLTEITGQGPLGQQGLGKQAPSAEYGAMAGPGSDTFGSAGGTVAGSAYLDYLADGTGAKVFSAGKFALDIRPFLAEFDKLLKQQVVLEYQGEGELRKVKMNRKLRGVRVLAPER